MGCEGGRGVRVALVRVRAGAEARDSTSPALARTHCSLLTTHDAPGERNYHVFYQLLAGMPAAELAALHLDAPLDSFGLVNQSGCVSIPGQDEAVEFARTRTAMGAVGLSTLTLTVTLTLTLTLTLTRSASAASRSGRPRV